VLALVLEEVAATAFVRADDDRAVARLDGADELIEVGVSRRFLIELSD
jgi:hypothetical protein